MPTSSRPRLFIFDQSVSSNSPVGSCIIAELVGLSADFHVTIFSNRCDIELSPNMRWIKVPLPQSPILFRYMLFQFAAPLIVAWHRVRGLPAADLRQTSEGQLVGAEVAYAHFCHRAYLKGPWTTSPTRGARRLARWLNHQFNAFWEGKAYRRAACIVVPSIGLAKELTAIYPEIESKLTILPNPVDLERFKPSADFDRLVFRSFLGISPDEVVFVFVALGDFARKGLGLTLAAVAKLPASVRKKARILVVGGQPGEIELFQAQAADLSLSAQVQFAGMQKDVRPYLWASDLLTFPSAYEVFSLAILQAAAAGLPVLVSAGLYGAEEFIVDGVNGWIVERSIEGVYDGLVKTLADPNRLKTMGKKSQESVQKYSQEHFIARWREIYSKLHPTSAH